jgi:hypothetical protein
MQESGSGEIVPFRSKSRNTALSPQLLSPSVSPTVKLRRFLLFYDNSKNKRSNHPVSHFSAEGVQFSGGAIAVWDGSFLHFTGMDELRERFERFGDYSLTWLDEE